MNEQIATALLRLQHDMADMLHRLHTLEVLTASQVKHQGCKPQCIGYISVSLYTTLLLFIHGQ